MSGCWLLMRRYCCITGVCCERSASFMVREGYRKTTRPGGVRWQRAKGARAPPPAQGYRRGGRPGLPPAKVGDPELYELAARAGPKHHPPERRPATPEA